MGHLVCTGASCPHKGPAATGHKPAPACSPPPSCKCPGRPVTHHSTWSPTSRVKAQIRNTAQSGPGCRPARHPLPLLCLTSFVSPCPTSFAIPPPPDILCHASPARHPLPPLPCPTSFATPPPLPQACATPPPPDILCHTPPLPQARATSPQVPPPPSAWRHLRFRRATHHPCPAPTCNACARAVATHPPLGSMGPCHGGALPVAERQDHGVIDE